MADSALLIGWNRSFAGREQQAMKLFMKTTEYYNQLQNDGKIENFEPVLLEGHGGDLNGFVLIRGDSAKLDEIKREETFISYSIEANFCLQNFGIIKCVIGDGLTDVLTQWSKHFS